MPDVVLSNEYCKPAHDTNKNNHQNTYHILGDITDDSVKQRIIKKCKKLKVNVTTNLSLIKNLQDIVINYIR